ncbi:DUF2075 domain-containing protein [Collinsella sp. An2]|uniref:DUF2075 domain-containing protein n=1 Tax=Collinsella sp. An2 TaxID=1965585 RepID=UPI000B3AEE1D|nr:DUF2075 domain-containing protein [Collinsella sp. An2]OUP09800.1 hypothetical protein B5F33_04225 [Collinsella sp. An2]
MIIEIPTREHASKPEGAPFQIDMMPFEYGKHVDIEYSSLAEDKLLDWPMVYILANDKSAYVGQTTSVATRINQHEANEEKRDFTTVNIIYNEEFNASVITDYEHRLISLMQADGRYRLTNKNEGMTRSNYFSKHAYADMFEELWEQLRAMELAEHTIDQIEESEVFKYSPYKGLTADQRIALEQIMDAITEGINQAKPIVIEGMPGTGKTVLAVHLMKMLKDDSRFSNMNIRLIEPVTSLRNTLRKTVSTVSGMSKKDVIGPADLAKESCGFTKNESKNFDIVLIDEAHKLKRRVNLGTQFGNYDKTCAKLGLPKSATQVDWVLSQAKLPIFFYDPLQAVGPSCVGPDAIDAILDSAASSPIHLSSQMRVKGGKGYLDFILDILNGTNPSPMPFEGYELVFHETPEGFAKSFEQTYSQHTLSRMVAGYAWKWVTKDKETPSLYDINLDSVHLRWNCTYDDWVGKGADNPDIAHEVGCIHSIQGYDLSYAYVIIGNDIVYDAASEQLIANSKSYYDRNGRATATKEELAQYIKNIYYVLLTRGIYGTHVYVANPELRTYLRRFFIDVEK